MMIKLSIVLPVYGSKLATIAEISADCILSQETDFSFELIVSNNGSDPTIKSIFHSNKFKNRIRYIEPEKVLPMPEHLEWASAFATGEYLMVLPARRVLKQGAIQKYISVMEENPQCSGCSSNFEEFQDETGYVTGNAYSNKGVVSSKKLIQRFENGQYRDFTEMYTTIPTAMNGLVRSKFIEHLRSEYNRPYFSNISPDVSSAFFHLFNSNYIFLIPEALFLTTSIHLSHGLLSIRSYNYYSSTLGGSSANYKFLPAFLEGNVYSSIWEDFARMKNLFETHEKVQVENVNPNKFISKLILQEELIKLSRNFTNKISFSRYKKIKKYFSEFGYFPEKESKVVIQQIASIIKSWAPLSIKKMYKKVFSKNKRFENIYQAACFEKNI